MSESSRSRVTITLGRDGQVVKRAGNAVNDSFYPNSHPSVGSKRSVRDRLGSNFGSTAQHNNKRQREDGNRFSDSNMMDGEEDLRFKLRRKNILNKNLSSNQQNDVDLRDMLSRPAYSSTTNLGSQKRLPELEDTRRKSSGLRDGRQEMPEPRTAARQLLPEHRNGRQYLPEPSVDRDLMQTKENKHLRPESNGLSIFGPIPSSRRSDALPHMDSLRNSYSPWTLESLRRRSPGPSRGLSPPRRNEEREWRPVLRAYDESRAPSYLSKEAFDHSRPMNSASYAAKPARTAEPAKPIVPVYTLQPPSVGLQHKSSITVDDHQFVDSFLRSLGLDKYVIHFKAEEVDMYALRQMGDHDLKELGIPMGPRKKILLTLLSRSKRQI